MLTETFAGRDEAELERAAFQRRLSLFAWIAFGQSIAFDLLSAAIALARGDSPGWVVSWPELVANLFLLLLALLCRYSRLSRRALAILDPVVIFAVAPTVLTSLVGPLDASAGLVASIATMPMCVVRAALVPSTLRRTLWITTIAALPGLIVTWMVPVDHVEPAARASVRLGRLLNTAVWWCIQVAVAGLITKIIYGLEQRVREAERLGQYVLEQKIGEGGMGVVYRASHALLRRPTALKLLRADQLSEQGLERFAREVQLTARLAHANIVTVYDFGRTQEGTFYYAMELLDGIDLQALVRVGGPLPAARVRHVLQQIAEALAEAHAIGLVHRDVKPANIMLCPPSSRHELAKLLDFGLVHDLRDVAGGMQQTAIERSNGDDDLERTRTGVRFTMGTPLYMAPEAISKPEDVGPLSDLYALSAVGYFLLTGLPVFDAPSLGGLCEQHLHAAPLAPSVRLGAPVHEGLERVILRSLAKAPEQRAASATAFADELSKLVGMQPWTADAARSWWARQSRRKSDDKAYAATAVDVAASRLGPLSMKLDLRHR